MFQRNVRGATCLLSPLPFTESRFTALTTIRKFYLEVRLKSEYKSAYDAKTDSRGALKNLQRRPGEDLIVSAQPANHICREKAS